MEKQHSQNLTIKNWAEEDRPREKLLLKGKSILSNAELIAILIGSGTKTMSAVDIGMAILAEFDNDLNKIARLTVAELMKFNGIGEARAITIVSALELGRRRKDTDHKKNMRITCAKETYDFIAPDLLDLRHEEFWVIFLKRNNEVIKKEKISAGGVAGTVVDRKIIFNKALECLASYMILVHNHPSGNLKPSNEDIQITKQLKEAGKLMDIPVVDHLIFTDASYFSFADESMI
jgi:DNA repair protein RadC